jgi:hypothetical protein
MIVKYYIVKITLDIDNVFFDAIYGLNPEDALRRAQWNWEGEQVEIMP